ncbi:MAG: protein jag [Lachnospiraceae bacterium]|nr:protein jag [Lachnospiraceae bacterium]
MEFIEVSAKTLSDAITEACQKLSVTSDRLYYEVVEEGSNGFLGIGSKPYLIKASIKEETEKAVEKEEKREPVKQPANETVKTVSDKSDKSEKSDKVEKSAAVEKAEKKQIVSDGTMEKKAEVFLKDVFHAMEIEAEIEVKYDPSNQAMDINLNGEEMGILIGKRGQTLDSLQYLVSLVVNKDSSDYIRVKVDTENYRQRRKETLENLAKNIAYKVKRTKRPVSLEPMNPYERRIIHSALQNDKYVTTHSEGDEPFRRVVVTLKR